MRPQILIAATAVSLGFVFLISAPIAKPQVQPEPDDIIGRANRRERVSQIVTTPEEFNAYARVLANFRADLHRMREAASEGVDNHGSMMYRQDISLGEFGPGSTPSTFDLVGEYVESPKVSSSRFVASAINMTKNNATTDTNGAKFNSTFQAGKVMFGGGYRLPDGTRYSFEPNVLSRLAGMEAYQVPGPFSSLWLEAERLYDRVGGLDYRSGVRYSVGELSATSESRDGVRTYVFNYSMLDTAGEPYMQENETIEIVEATGLPLAYRVLSTINSQPSILREITFESTQIGGKPALRRIAETVTRFKYDESGQMNSPERPTEIFEKEFTSIEEGLPAGTANKGVIPADARAARVDAEFADIIALWLHQEKPAR